MMINQLIILNPIIAIVFFSIFCLMIGSLLNVIIYRIPLMLQEQWSQHCADLMHLKQDTAHPLNLFYPRSFCPKCKIMIAFWHNIPILSFFLLKGRCSQCHTKISWRYPLIELSCLLLSLLAAYTFGFNLNLLFALLFIWLIICLSAIDAEHQLLPDSLSLGLLWLGLIANTQALFTSLPNAVLSAASAYLLLWLFIKIYYLISAKVGMGDGDFKLFAAFGAWFGWNKLPLILLMASISGAIVGIIYLKLSDKSHDTPIAFGPFLCLAGLITLFYGNNIIAWYLSIA